MNNLNVVTSNLGSKTNKIKLYGVVEEPKPIEHKKAIAQPKPKTKKDLKKSTDETFNQDI